MRSIFCWSSQRRQGSDILIHRWKSDAKTRIAWEVSHLLILAPAGGGRCWWIILLERNAHGWWRRRVLRTALDGVLEFWTIIRTATISSRRNVNLDSLDPFKILIFCHLPYSTVSNVFTRNTGLFAKDQNDVPKDAPRKSIKMVTFQCQTNSFHLWTIVDNVVMLLLQTGTISIEEVLEKLLTMATFGSTEFFVITTLWGKAESVDSGLAGK